MRRTSRHLLTSIVLVVIVILAITCYTLMLPETTMNKTSLWLKFYHDYLKEYYKPRPITKSDIGSYPQLAHVANMPWISYNKSYCASICLQMVTYKHGLNMSLGLLNFIMGFTYGAAYMQYYNFATFIPGGEPILGYVYAAEQLGFEYHMLVTNDEETFIDACRYLISKDIPVILPVDASKLYNTSGHAPHFELLVGYEDDMFYLYEPVMNESKFTYGERGIAFSCDTIAKASKALSELFYYPWKYTLIYFTVASSPKLDMKSVLLRVGELQVGFVEHGMAIGSKAIEMFANRTAEGKIKAEDYTWALLYAITTRRDNAAFLRSYFKGNTLIEQAANKLEQAASLYAQALDLARDGLTISEKIQFVQLLHQAAKLEEEVGRLMIEAASSL